MPPPCGTTPARLLGKHNPVIYSIIVVKRYTVTAIEDQKGQRTRMDHQEWAFWSASPQEAETRLKTSLRDTLRLFAQAAKRPGRRGWQTAPHNKGGIREDPFHMRPGRAGLPVHSVRAPFRHQTLAPGFISVIAAIVARYLTLMPDHSVKPNG